MSRPTRIAAIALLAAVIAGVVAFAVFYTNPIGLSIWLGRHGLGRAGLERQTFAAPAGELVYFEGGRGDPVVLLHGAGDQAGNWNAIVPALVARHRLLIPDLPGHGESAPASGPLPLAGAVAALEALLAARAPSETVTLVGNSMGGWIALLYAREHPTRLRRVVLVNGGAIRGEMPTGFTLLPRNRQEARATLRALTGPQSPQPPDFVLDDLVEKIAGGALPRTVAGFRPSDLLDGQLADLAVPVALVWGDADQLMPPAYAERQRAAIPGATLALLPGCGHVPQAECPTALLAALEPLLTAPSP